MPWLSDEIPWASPNRPPADVAFALIGGELRLPVAPGTAVTDDGRCSCGNAQCPRPGLHPQVADWQQNMASRPEDAGWYWGHDPAPALIVPTGRRFDALEMPAPFGSRLLGRSIADGVVGGPIISVGERWYVFTRVTTVPPAVDVLDGVVWHGSGHYVVWPPSGSRGGLRARWIVAPPQPWDGEVLPHAGELLTFLLTDTAPAGKPVPLQDNRLPDAVGYVPPPVPSPAPPTIHRRNPLRPTPPASPDS